MLLIGTWYYGNNRVISLLTSLCGIASAVRKWGRGEVGSHGWCGGVLGFAREFNIAHDLMCQPDSRSQSGSLSRKGLGSQAPRIIHEYNLATAISM